MADTRTAAPPTPSAGPEERYYYADGKKVPLATSGRYVAVRAEGDNGARPARAESFARGMATLPAAVQVIDLPEHHLAVLAVPPTAGDRPAGAGGGPSPAGGAGNVKARRLGAGAEALRAMVDAQPDLNAGPPVYEAAEVPTGEGLIPIGEVLVKFKPDVTDDQRRRVLDKNNLEVKRADYPEPGTHLVAVKGGPAAAVAAGQETVPVANRLHESELVEFAQPNFVRLMPRLTIAERYTATRPGLAAPGSADLPRFTGARTPRRAYDGGSGGGGAGPAPTGPTTDPSFASQWGLFKIQAPEAFDITMGSPDISVAVIDEGCDLNHEDVDYKLPGYDAYTGTDNPQPSGNDAHGTACAGIAASRANNGIGGAGVAPGCKVLPVRIAKGIPSGWSTTDAMIADGIRKAVDRGADVLSNSWGGGGASTVITNAFHYAQTTGRGGKGCPIAIATGNDDVNAVGYPANLSPTIPGLLAVGASNEWDQRKSATSLDGETWWGSNYGPEVDVVAPGVHIFSPDIMGGAGYGAGNYVPNFNGTSSATPHVAGLMGLVLSVDPDLRSWEVEEIIKMTAEDLGPAGRDEEFGFGRINCRRALEAAARLWYEVNVVPEFIGAGRECFMRVNVRFFNPGINAVRLDGFTFASHSSDGSTEIDRFEFAPNPGGVMAARAGGEVRVNGILLKANGTETGGWDHQWSMGWGYTFWRPGAPGLPLSPGGLVESQGRRVIPDVVRGSGEMPSPTARPGLLGRAAAGAGPRAAGARGPATNGNSRYGDSITVDREDKSITIVIR